MEKSKSGLFIKFSTVLICSFIIIFSFSCSSPDSENEAITDNSDTDTRSVTTVGCVPLYRYYNAEYCDHFYTTNWNEIGDGAAYGYVEHEVQEYIYNWQAPGTVPLYRCYYPPAVNHLYTISQAELDYAVSIDYNYNYTEEYVYPTKFPGTVPMYRFYHGDFVDHYYSRDSSIPSGYTSSGIAFYVVPAESMEFNAQSALKTWDIIVTPQDTENFNISYYDSSFGIARYDDNQYQFFTSIPVPAEEIVDVQVTRWIGTYDIPYISHTTVSPTNQIYKIYGMDNPYNIPGCHWLENIYQDGSDLLGFVHTEWANGITKDDEGNWRDENNVVINGEEIEFGISLALSRNNGVTWRVLGQIIRLDPTHPTHPTSAYMNITGVPYIVTNDEHFIIYFRDGNSSGGSTAMAKSSATVEDVLLNAVSVYDSGGTLTPWYKYYNGSFSENEVNKGIFIDSNGEIVGGVFSPIPGEIPLDVSLHGDAGKIIGGPYVLSGCTESENSPRGIWTATSNDGITWDNFKYHNNEAGTDGQSTYVTLFSKDTSDNQGQLTDPFYVYQAFAWDWGETRNQSITYILGKEFSSSDLE